MTDDSPDSLLGAFFQLIIGLAGMALGLAVMVGSLVLFVALLGAAFDIFFGNPPMILEPFGGALVEFLASLVKLLVTIAMGVISVVMLGVMILDVTGQTDIVEDGLFNELFDEQKSVASRRQESADNQKPTQNSGKTRPRSSDDSSSLADSSAPTGTTNTSNDTEFDEYGQIQEE